MRHDRKQWRVLTLGTKGKPHLRRYEMVFLYPTVIARRDIDFMDRDFKQRKLFWQNESY